MALLVLGLVAQSDAFEWTIGTENTGPLSASSYIWSGGSQLGLYGRCDITEKWNVGVTWASSKYHTDGQTAEGSDDGTETLHWKQVEIVEWYLVTLGRRLVSSHRFRYDVILVGGYESMSRDGGSYSPEDTYEKKSHSLALGLRPEVKVYRNLWVTGQFGVRWVESDSRREDRPISGARVTITETSQHAAFSYGGFAEYQLGLLWTF